MNAAGQASYETTPSCPRKILGAAWAQSGQPLKVGQDSATTDRRDLGVTPVSQQSRSRFEFLMGYYGSSAIGKTAAMRAMGFRSASQHDEYDRA
jgi:hypothetical protein